MSRLIDRQPETDRQTDRKEMIERDRNKDTMGHEWKEEEQTSRVFDLLPLSAALSTLVHLHQIHGKHFLFI